MDFSGHIASLKKEGRLENPEDTYSHYHANLPHVTKDKYMKDMAQLKKLEEKHSLLSLIEDRDLQNNIF